MRIFDIKKTSWNDGPGLRTVVFLKGCTLNCFYCHNPESISSAVEIMLEKNRCTFCGTCQRVCPKSCHAITDGDNPDHRFDNSECDRCEECVKNCPAGAIKKVGSEEDVSAIFETVVADKEFYDVSKVGVTLSGGEPLLQADDCATLLGMCKEAGINTAADTSGNVGLSWFSVKWNFPILK